MYQVSVVRSNRQTVPLTPSSTDASLREATATPQYAALHGKIDVGRIVHICYIACGTANDVLLKWMTDPMASHWVNININNTVFGLANPWEIDRWSYNEEMHIKYTILAVAQTLYVEVVEYEVVKYEKALTQGQQFLKILANGQARMAEYG